MRYLRKPHSDKGAALITSIMVMMLVSMLGLAYLTITSTNLIRASRDERSATAFYLAEAGLEFIIAEIIDDAETNGGIIETWDYDTSSVLNGLRSGTTGQVIVTPDSGSKSATITSTATYRSITERIRIHLKVKDIGVWNNAIFAGIGQSGKGINGNVNVRGSVHILGDGEPYSDLNGNGQRDGAEPYTDTNGNGQYDPGEPFTDLDGNGVWSPAEPFQDNNLNGVYDPPLNATDFITDISGDANIGNNYSGMPADLAAKIPTLISQSFGGEMVQTLNAELRVKHGKVSISGSGNVGNANVTSNTIKETVDGCFVTDGYGGNKGITSVFSDNGTSQKYDLGDRVPFPSLLSPYTDPVTGTNYDSYQDYLVANSALVAVPKIDSTVASFTAGSGSNTISWDQATSTLTISGIVRISGNLDIGTKDMTVNYSGKGTMYATGTVKVHGSVMPTTMFPTTDVMGVIAGVDIEFATGSGESQLSGAGAWYAERTIKSAKQNKFAGTYVANYFDMGSNVPSIYQVPSLVDNLPPGMPGGNSVVVAQIMSWRHLSQSD